MRPGKSCKTVSLGGTTTTNAQVSHLWLVTAELSVAVGQSLQPNGELDVAAADDVLNLELGELGVEPKLLDDARVLARRQPRVVLRLCSRHNHLAGRKDEGGRLWFTDTHDDGGETLEKTREQREVRHASTLEDNCATNLGVVFSIPRMQRNRLQVEPTVEVDRSDDVLEGGDDPLDSGDVLLLEGEGDGGLWHRRRTRGTRYGVRRRRRRGLGLLGGEGVGQRRGPGEGEVGRRRLWLLVGAAGEGEAILGLLLELLLLLLLLLLISELLLGGRVGAAKVDLTSGQCKRHFF